MRVSPCHITPVTPGSLDIEHVFFPPQIQEEILRFSHMVEVSVYTISWFWGNMTFILRPHLSDFPWSTEISIWPLSEKKALL